jgi:hypothetical protein
LFFCKKGAKAWYNKSISNLGDVYEDFFKNQTVACERLRVVRSYFADIFNH